MEGKGGHACPSYQPHEVSKVIFPEVRCRWENSEKQSEPGSRETGDKRIAAERAGRGWNLESLIGLDCRLPLSSSCSALWGEEQWPGGEKCLFFH